MATDAADKSWLITQFIDKHGKILEKVGNPVHSILEMEWENGGIYARFRVMMAAQGNGSYKVQVRADGKEVMNAYGRFMGEPRGVTVETYEPGDWEQIFGL